MPLHIAPLWAAAVLMQCLGVASLESPSVRPPIPQQITWFYAHDLNVGAAFLGEVMGLEEVRGLLQKSECRIFESVPNAHFCAVCNTRVPPNCSAATGGAEQKDNPGKSTYTLVVSSRAQVDAWHTYLVQKNPSRVVATFPEFSSKFDVYAFNFYDTDSNHGLGCYRWEVQYFEDPAWPQPSL